MRRSDRELKDMADIVAIAKRETVCTVAFHDESCPYLIPLNYGAEVEEGKLVLYFHGAKEGRRSIRSERILRFHIVFTGKIAWRSIMMQPASRRQALRVSAETELHIRGRSHIEEKSSGEPHESDESEEGIRRELVRGGNGERSDGLEDRN